MRSATESAENAAKSAGNTRKSEEEAIEFAKKIKEFASLPIDRQTPETKLKISEYVEIVRETKPEAKQTAEDWYFKGFNALTKAQSQTERYQKESNLKEAIFYYQKSVGLGSNDSAIFNSWGYALNELGKLKREKAWIREAIEKFEKAAKLDFNFAIVFYNMARSYIENDSDFSPIKSDPLFKELLDRYLPKD